MYLEARHPCPKATTKVRVSRASHLSKSNDVHLEHMNLQTRNLMPKVKRRKVGITMIPRL